MTTTATRAQLQQYFATNCIPTQNNFTDLINGMLNQTDDGIVKSAGNPLSIGAAGDATTSQKVLNLYANLSDPNPAWTLQLNPRSNQNDSTTAHSGFSVSDATGTSRLFIDASSYNVGIGTNTPAAKLDINGGANVGGALSVTGAANLNNTLSVTGVATLNSALTVTGAAILNNTLTVTGATTVNNALTVTGASNVGGILKVSGAASINNTLTVTGTATLSNNLTVSGTASFTNSLTVSAGNVRIGYDDQSTVTRIVCFQKDSTDDANAGKIIYKPQWPGNSNTALNIVGAGSSNTTRNIKLWDNVEIVNNLTIDGLQTIGGTLSVTGTVSFNNNATVSGSLTVNGPQTIGGTLSVTGSANFNNNASVNGSLTIRGETVYPKIAVIPNQHWQNGANLSQCQWNINLSSYNFTSIYTAFVIFQGFSLWDTYIPNGNHTPSSNDIPQTAYVELVGYNTTNAWGVSYCSCSSGSEYNDSVMFTLVVIGI